MEFDKTFSLLYESLEDCAFKKYKNDSYKGAFSLPIFEVVAFGLGNNICKYGHNVKEDLKKIKEVSERLPNIKEFIDNSGSGANISHRLPNLIKLGRELFGKYA